MDDERDITLNTVIKSVRRRWGSDAVRPLSSQRALTAAVLSTGLPALDDALGGGLSIGRLTEICGTPTSGASTLALRLVAAAQAGGATAVWVDAAQTLDADYADHCAVNLDNLLLVRPDTGRAALEIAGDLVGSRSADLIVVAPGLTPLEAPAGGWQKLAVRVAKSPLVLLMVCPEGDRPSTDKSYVSLRLRVERTAWWWAGAALRGWDARVTVVKNKLGPAGQTAAFRVELPERQS
jgi:RecA/RadA recombinase